MVKDAILFVEYLEGAESRKTSYHASLQPLQLVFPIKKDIKPIQASYRKNGSQDRKWFLGV
jgi:hypothetical protein